jgi:hypothetical protein
MKKITRAMCMAFATLSVAALAPGLSLAQSPQSEAAANTVQVVADPQYNKAGKLKRVLLGQHYRKEWDTQVEVPVLDMQREAGGLTPTKLGGGLQTMSLRLKGADGREYVLRSVRKDPSKALVAELRGTFAEDVVQDQISSANPYAPMAVAALADAAGILHSTPKMVFVPKSPLLGEYDSAFAETLCLCEERPSGSEVVNSEKLLERVFSNSKHQVDQKAFLKARLFDMLIGDWDRHEDQWQWKESKQDGVTTYYPIPRDRDQAFARMDGVIPTIAARKWALRKIKHFDYTIEDIAGLNINGLHLDRNFTTQLLLNDWLAVAGELQQALTDSIIDAAMKQMPAPIYNISGAETAAKLKRRRDDLQTYATQYYRILAQQVDIVGTNQKEIFEVQRLNNDSTKITVYNAAKGTAVYERTFLSAETKRIRLHGLEGDDEFRVDEAAKKGKLVRVIDNRKQKYERKAFKYDLLSPMINPAFNPDDGIFIGASVIYKKQKFGKTPYGYMQTVGANYATRTGAYSIWYEGIFKQAVGRWDLNVGASFRAPSFNRNFYGLGNETPELDVNQKYYRVRMSQYELLAGLERQFGNRHWLAVRSRFQASKVERNEDRFIAKLDSSTFERKYYQSIEANYQYNTLDNQLYPRRGVRFNAGAAYVQNLKEGARNFVQLSSDASAYKSFGTFTLGARAGVAANLDDDFEFFQANTLGNLTNLRGYRRDRYAGKTSAYSNAELRWRAGKMNAYVVQGYWGLLAFWDQGRVWMPNEESTKWHHGYGGGIWFLPFSRMAVTATYGISEDNQLLTVTGRFIF